MISLIRSLLFCCLMSGALHATAQEQTGRKPSLVASASAFSLGKNEAEVLLFSSFNYRLYPFNFSAAPYTYLQQPYNSLLSGAQVTYGLTGSQRINLGLDLQHTLTWDHTTRQHVAGYGQIGPRIRWRPFPSIDKFLDVVVQNSVLFTAGDRQDLLDQGVTFRNQIITSRFFRVPGLNMDAVLQSVIGLDVVPRSTASGVDLRKPVVMPLSLLLGIMPNDVWVVFGAINHSTEWGTIPWVEGDAYFTRRTATSLSLGTQYVIARKHSLFLAHSFLIGQSYGGGSNSVQLGFRYLFLQTY